MADAKKVLDAEVAGGKRLLQLGFMREYDPAHKAVKEYADRGDLGELLMFRGIHSNYGLAPRTTEDVIINSAIHDIHSARWLLGEIAEVYVQRVVADQAQPESCRLLLVQLTATDGSLGQIEVNANSSYGYQVDVELTGTQASIRTAPASAPTVRKAGKQFKVIDEDWLEHFEMAYIYEVQVWVQSLIEGKATGPSTWDGYAAMVVADACVQSASLAYEKSAKKPVAVPALERPEMYAR